jgi:hypothetical protein
MKLETFDEIKTHLSGKKNWPVHLLVGNGFSIAYNKSIFSYNALSQFVENTNNPLLQQLFSITKNKNFEVIMQQLDMFYQLAGVFSFDQKARERIKETNEALQLSLIEAIKELHPDHVFTIPDDESKNCYQFVLEFLNNGGNIFTTNYDLLLYWVLMRNKQDNDILIDGFGRDAENISEEWIPPEEIEYSELRWGKHKSGQNIHYIHGALPLFDTGVEVVKEEYDGANYLLERIKANLANKVYPIFVTAGDGNDKLRQIMHNKYLSYCYERFSNIEGSLLTFGFNFGEYDDHIINAINIAAKQGKKVTNKLWSIYIGVYNDADKQHIEAIESKFKCKVHIYDAKTTKIWRG